MSKKNTRAEKFERIVHFEPAFDKRSSDAQRNYGIGAVTIWFVLKGPKGAITFGIETDWYLPRVRKELGVRNYFDDQLQPRGYDIGYHSLRPTYKGQLPFGKCKWLNDRTCYYDGSSLRADEWVRSILLPRGSDGVWEALQEEYDVVFGRK